MFRRNLDAGGDRDAYSVISRRFVEAAERGDAEATVADSFENKLGEVRDGTRGRAAAKIQPLLAAAREAHAVWQQRDRLSRADYVLLAAALLYFISPVDPVPDIVPVVGYADDLAVFLFILERLSQAIKGFATEVIQHNVDLTIEKFNQTANRSVDRVVTTISIGFWAATSMAAISLIVQQVNHGLPAAWHAYMVSVAGLTLVWNGAVAIEFYGKFRKLDAPWRDRILDVVTARLGWSHALRVGFPVVLWLAFAGMRMLAV